MAPEPYRSRFAPESSHERGPYNHAPHQADLADWWEMSPTEVAAEQALYEASIAYLDNELDLLLKRLEEEGFLDETVVIITSDHGEAFGERRVFAHGNSLYLPQLNVPLLILGPDVPTDRRVSSVVSLRDLPNTIMDAAGVGEMRQFPGTSIARLWLTPDSASSIAADTLLFQVTGGFGPSEAPLSRGDMWSALSQPFQYIRNGDGVEELYNVMQDPDQEGNLLAAGGDTAIVGALRSVVDRARSRP